MKNRVFVRDNAIVTIEHVKEMICRESNDIFSLTSGSLALLAVKFIYVAFKSEPIAGPYGLKIIPPILVRLYLFTSEIFRVFLRRILIARIRYTIEMCFHIPSSYTN